ncbi:hypothetical protein W59_27341 [Rhodococcus opacus RKJ300 = JCM 13270]|uniref:YCII-related domain-containing protein n=1 Tax=Rhodococcus opacus RKJ300 = JCM 13270 TaxID=1165867 RepID=I0WHI2_RHOOP|nr:hypothetical protein W59_27341 [Rhodococcus opacus RKJ300 = JCM 13270]
MQYMLLIYNCERPEQGDPGFADASARVNAFADECRRGVFFSGHPLQPERTATTVSVRDGRSLITDGPFAETHEHLGGAYVLDCRNLDEALELAALCPLAELGSIEVRPIVDRPIVDNRTTANCHIGSSGFVESIRIGSARSRKPMPRWCRSWIRFRVSHTVRPSRSRVCTTMTSPVRA